MRDYPRRLLTAALCLSAVALSACVPVLTPPVDVQYAAGSAHGRTTRDGTSPKSTQQLRVGLTPLSIGGDFSTRKLDPSAGVLLRWDNGRRTPRDGNNFSGTSDKRESNPKPGAFIGLDSFPWQHRGAGWAFRTRIQPSVDLVVDDGRAGWGGRVATGIELVSQQDGVEVHSEQDEDTGSDGTATDEGLTAFHGVAVGELGIGLLLGGNVHKFDSKPSVWSIDVGVSVRVPLVLGIACCLVPDLD